MGNLEITIEDKRGSEVQNKYDIVELLLMLTLRHTLTNRNSISPCKTCTSHDVIYSGGLVLWPGGSHSTPILHGTEMILI